MELKYIVSHYLDELVFPKVRIGNKSWSVFQVCGYTGLGLAIIHITVLTTYLGLSYIVLAGILLTGVATFLGLAMITKIIIGEERLIYYHHEIAIILMVALILWISNQPIWPYLDITILGIGTFLFCGRVGCLMVGCCHGKPHHWGVCYGKEHANAGFTPYYVSVRLFPIQAVESLWVFIIVIIGASLVITKQPAGSALAWYVITYDIGRFFFEFKRGDPSRLYFWGFSEGQWISVILMAVVVALQFNGFLPLQWWHVGATVGLIVIMGLITVVRYLRKSDLYKLNNARHVREIASTLERLSNYSLDIKTKPLNSNDIQVATTSLGVRISGTQIKDEQGTHQHYALSREHRKLTLEDATGLMRIILQLTHFKGTLEFVQGHSGVFHLILHPSPS